MNVFRGRLLLMVCIVSILGLGAGHWSGSELEAANPNGIWIYTPPANHTGPAPPAYPIGFAPVVFVTGAMSVFLSVCFWLIARFRFQTQRRLAIELLIASLICCVVFFVAYGFVDYEYARNAL